MRERPILLAAGGTGGHLFPAFALAEELDRRHWSVELATDMRGDRYGLDFPAEKVHRISSATLGNRSPIALARTGYLLAAGIYQAYKLIGKMRPAAVIGFGGYPSFPPLVGARLRGIPTALHEQNAVLGRANRMLVDRVTAVATSFENVQFINDALRSKVRLTGNPVRDIVVAQAAKSYPVPPSVESEKRFNLLVFGGSQGARFFSERIPSALSQLSEAERLRLSVTQQCREEDLEAVRATYAQAGIDAECATFFQDLPLRIAASHLVIGRAGASSIAELTVIGRPSILVPLPHALDNDQLRNAESLANAGGAICISQADLTDERLRADLTNIMSNSDELIAAAANAKSMGRPDAVLRLADLVEELAGAATSI
ncbi:MAG: undecaprenyldiphospho-muramoylpentapeptide beta-N-acetylglucosaminyltransferase [Hyphomicrobiaceae bacterium]